MSDWINHVKKYQRKHGLTYKEALQRASKSYSGGSLQSKIKKSITGGGAGASTMNDNPYEPRRLSTQELQDIYNEYYNMTQAERDELSVDDRAYYELVREELLRRIQEVQRYGYSVGNRSQPPSDDEDDNNEKDNITVSNQIRQAELTGGSLKSNYIRNIIYKNDFDVNKMKKPSNYIVKKFKAPKKVEKVIKKEPESENDIIISNWEDPYIGNLIYNTKIGQNISNLIEKKNSKNEYVLDVFLLSFTKPINDQIIVKYGVESLFNGINEIASYMDADKYEIKFGKDKSLPIGKYLNKKSLKEVMAVNKEKLSLNGGRLIKKVPTRINFKI